MPTAKKWRTNCTEPRKARDVQSSVSLAPLIWSMTSEMQVWTGSWNGDLGLIVEWFSLGETLKLIQFQPSAIGKDTPTCRWTFKIWISDMQNILLRNVFSNRKCRTWAINTWYTGSPKDTKDIYCTQHDLEILHLLINKKYFKIQQQWKTVINCLLNMILLQTAKFPWAETHCINGPRPYQNWSPGSVWRLPG